MMKAESERAKEADVIREKEQYHERVSARDNFSTFKDRS